MFMYPQGRKNLPFGTKSGGGGNVGADGANTSSAHLFGTGGGGDFGLLLLHKDFGPLLVLKDFGLSVVLKAFAKL